MHCLLGGALSSALSAGWSSLSLSGSLFLTFSDFYFTFHCSSCCFAPVSLLVGVCVCNVYAFGWVHVLLMCQCACGDVLDYLWVGGCMLMDASLLLRACGCVLVGACLSVCARFL